MPKATLQLGGNRNHMGLVVEIEGQIYEVDNVIQHEVEMKQPSYARYMEYGMGFRPYGPPEYEGTVRYVPTHRYTANAPATDGMYYDYDVEAEEIREPRQLGSGPKLLEERNGTE